MTHGERRTAAAVAVDLGEDHAGEREALVEGLGRVDGVLAEHGVDHEERFNGLEEGVELGNLLHHRLVDGQTAGRVDDEHVEELASGMVDGGSGNLERLLADGAREPFGARLFGHRLELFDGGRTINVGGHRENLLALRFDEVLGQLASARRLARALKTGEKDDSGRLGVKIDVVSSRCTTPTKAWPGLRLPTTSSPMAFSLMRASTSRTTGRATSASRSAMRTSRSMSFVFSSVRRA